MNATRKAPANIEAEQSVLGSMLIEQEALYAGLELLTEADFYRPAHTSIFAALRRISASERPPDLITLQDELRRAGHLEEVGGTEYLMSLIDRVPSAANIEHYANIVGRDSLRRQWIATATKQLEIAYGTEDDFDEQIMRLIHDQLQEKSDGASTPKELCHTLWKRYEAYEHGERPPVVHFRLAAMNRLLYGIGMNELFVVGMDTSQGKSVLLADIANQCGVQEVPCLFFSYEMSDEEIMSRLIHAQASCDYRKTREGQVNWDALTPAIGRAANYQLEIRPGCSMSKLEAIAQRWRMRHARAQKAVIVIDYAQLVFDTKRYTSEVAEAADIYKRMKRMAQRLNVGVATASQLRKRPPSALKPESHKLDEDYAPAFPTIEDLAGSSEIKNSADKVLIGVNPPDADCDTSGKRCAWFKVAKHRNGMTGTFRTWFWPQYTRFDDYDESDDGYSLPRPIPTTFNNYNYQPHAWADED